MNPSHSSHQELPQFPESLWVATTELPTFSRLAEDIETDVAIVGAGITGITTAYLLAKAGKDVVLIEAGQILNGTTGHTTAKVTAQHGLIYHEFLNHFGDEKTRLYYEGNREAIEFIRDIVGGDEEKFGLKLEDAYIYAQTEDKYLSKLEDEIKAYEKLGIPGEWQESLPLPLPVRGAIKMPGQYQFHPLQYLKHLTEQFLKLGGRIYENTTMDEKSKTTDRSRCSPSGAATGLLATTPYPRLIFRSMTGKGCSLRGCMWNAPMRLPSNPRPLILAACS